MRNNQREDPIKKTIGDVLAGMILVVFYVNRSKIDNKNLSSEESYEKKLQITKECLCMARLFSLISIHSGIYHRKPEGMAFSIGLYSGIIACEIIDYCERQSLTYK